MEPGSPSAICAILIIKWEIWSRLFSSFPTGGAGLITRGTSGLRRDIDSGPIFRRYQDPFYIFRQLGGIGLMHISLLVPLKCLRATRCANGGLNDDVESRSYLL